MSNVDRKYGDELAVSPRNNLMTDTPYADLYTLHEAQRRFKKLRYSKEAAKGCVGVVYFDELLGNIFRIARINGLILK